MQAPNYRFNASLLNAFQGLLDSEALWEEFYGSSEEPKYTLEEWYAKQEQELLDGINRVQSEPIEAADRGTCMNEIVDCIIEHRKPVDKIGIQSIRDPEGRPLSIAATLNGFRFVFDANLCMELASYFRGSICQHLCEAIIETAYGPVILYGYSDYIRRDVVYDLKTTGYYKYGKYESGWQKDLYPWCLIESGELDRVSGFEYTAVKLSGGGVKDPIITGEVFREWYDYNHPAAGDRLRGICEALVLWVEQHREQITHPRIFNK